MTSMSTPVSQLPQQVNPNMVPKLEDDPVVTDMIKEMESYNPSSNPPVHHAQHAQHPQHLQHPQQPTIIMQQMPPSLSAAPPVMTTLYDSPKTTIYGIDITILKKAAILAVVALLIFYPDDLSIIYERVPYLSKFAVYDKIIRTVLLIVVVYLILWKAF